MNSGQIYLSTCSKKSFDAIRTRRIVLWKIAPRKIAPYLNPNPNHNPNPGGDFFWGGGDLPGGQFSVHGCE